MILTNLKWKTFGTLMGVSASVVAVSGRSVRAQSQAAAQVPVVSNDPAVQRTIEAQLTRTARLDSEARIGSLDLRGKSLRECIDAIAKAGEISVRYASDATGLDTPSSITLPDGTVEDALRAVLANTGLTFQAAAPKSAFIFPDTPANRDKYTRSYRVFVIANGDPAMVASELNRVLRSPTAVFQPMILMARDSRSVIVSATPEMMAIAAAWIAEHDRDQ